jgi:hypothetical protein
MQVVQLTTKMKDMAQVLEALRFSPIGLKYRALRSTIGCSDSLSLLFAVGFKLLPAV